MPAHQIPPRPASRTRRLATLLAAVALLATLPVPAGAGAPPGAAQAPAEGTRPAVAVTLVTGDRVLLRDLGGGRRTATVTPAGWRRGARVAFTSRTVGRDLWVIPGDVGRLVGRVLDPALFNVSELARMGYADDRAASLPLIVQHANTRRADLPGTGLRPVRELASVRATAVHQPRAAAGGLGRALAAAGRGASGGSTGIGRLWLDRKVKGTALDWNLTQVKAPAAWRQGLTGRGVRVAVLDSGIDATHPDLRGKVVAEANFSDAPDVTDRAGHGTHVAATVAGTGALSTGRRRGVAFGASLLNGKVLDDFGFGYESRIITAMEWATRHRAKVVNMSLGGFETDGSDPLSQAVNRLTASTGTLFVVSAGNAGPNEGTIGSPGAADAALTVGAVDADDQLAEFSSRGPRFGDYALKPDITAPGVDVVQARAAGTGIGDVVDRWYMRLSGTSMAAPHVAGAAAILAQRHPRWTAGRLKSVLMGTADPNPRLTVYQQGGGRLDVGQAVRQRLVAGQANLDFGLFRYPQAGVRPATRTVRYSNTGRGRVTVRLGVDLRDDQGRPAPPGMAAVSPATLVLPAGGSATARVTVDPRQGPRGRYSGAVRAVPSAGPPLQTPVGFDKETERYELTVTATRRDGTRDSSQFGGPIIFDRDNLQRFLALPPLDEHGQASVRVPPGRYHVMGFVYEADLATASLVGDPEILVRGDTAVALDARRARPTSAAIEGRATRPAAATLSYTAEDAAATFQVDSGLAVPSGGQVFAQPTDPVTRGSFEAAFQWRLLPAVASSPATASHLYDLLFYGPTIPDPPTFTLPAARAAELARVTNRFRVLGDRADYLESRIGLSPSMFFSFSLDEPVAAPRTRVEYLTPDPVSWQQSVVRSDQAGQLVFSEPEPVAHGAGERRERTWLGAPLGPDGFGVRFADLMYLDLGWNDTAGHPGIYYRSDWSVSQAMRLYRDGRLLADWSDQFGSVVVPDAQARYRLERDVDAGGSFALATVDRTRWWFRSAAPAEDFASLPLLDLDWGLPELDARNRLPRGTPATLDLAVRRQEGAEPSQVVAARLWFSADDGRTWREARLRRVAEGRYRAVLPGDQLPAGGRVSLRAGARDADGGAVRQTLVRAFAVG